MNTAVGLDAVQRHVISRRLGAQACALHERHSPRVVAGVRWSLFPEFLQMALWGEVRDSESVWLCPGGEVAVLLALTDLLIGQGWSAVFTEGERRYALLAFDRWQQACS